MMPYNPYQLTPPPTDSPAPSKSDFSEQEKHALMGYCQVTSWDEVPVPWHKFQSYRKTASQHKAFLERMQRSLALQEGLHPEAFNTAEFTFPISLGKHMKDLDPHNGTYGRKLVGRPGWLLFGNKPQTSQSP